MYQFVIDEKGVPADRVILYGGSLGGAIAVELACRFDHRALVLVSAFTSIADMTRQQFPWLPFLPWFVQTRFDSLTRIGACKGPIFIAHGTADRLVPFGHGERLCAAAPQPCRFFPMEG